jgi:amidase
VFTDIGCDVDDGEPDFAGVDELFQTWRAAAYAAAHAHNLERHRSQLKDTVVWNIERGLALGAEELARAESLKADLDERISLYFENHEFLVLPVAQVVPFAIETEWVRSIEGLAMQTYVDWMATCYAISCTGLPAISVPCGFTPEGLPVGLQIVGRRGRDLAVLQLAHAFEQATQWARRRPSLV